MSDLMNSQEKNFDEFAKKYNNFIVPSCDISIDGSSITDKEFNITNVRVSLSVEGKAGMADFSVSNCYSTLKKAFDSNIKSKLKLGSKVKISFGYSKKNIEIFAGYIDSLTYEFSEVPKINVVCMDVMSALMQNSTIERKNKESKLSDFVNDILNKYKSLIDKSEVDTIESAGMQIVQKMTDYQFIKSIAGENGFEFFAVGGNVYFRKSKSNKTPVTTLTYGENILHFSREVKYKNVEVTVYGKKDKNKETVSGTESGITNFPYIKNTFVSKNQIIGKRVSTEAEAKKAASNEVKKIIEDAYSSNLECIGIPELIPGRYIKLKDLDNDFNDTYYITSANHNFAPGQYTVSLNLSSTK